MPTTSELVTRLRALAKNMATLETVAGQCAHELQSLSELAMCLDRHSPQSSHSLEPLHVGRFTVDRATFSVSDGNRRCELGNTIGFRFLECLASGVNRYFTRSELQAAVWDGQRRAATTIRSTAFALRNQFRQTGMDDLADALRAEGCAYGLRFATH